MASNRALPSRRRRQRARRPPPRRRGCSTPPGRSGPARYRRSAGGRPRSARPGDTATCRRAGRHGGPASPEGRRPRARRWPRLKAWRWASSSACRRARRSAMTGSGTRSASSARRRSRPRAVLEREGARETDVRDKPHRVLELALRLAREADDEVGREGDVGPRPAHAIDQAAVFVAGMPAVHGREHAVRARLHRQVQVGHQRRQVAMGRDQRRRPCRADGSSYSAGARGPGSRRGAASRRASGHTRPSGPSP